MPGFKAKAALAAIKGDKALAELPEQFDVHQSQIQHWKKQLLDQADSVFGISQERKKKLDRQHVLPISRQCSVLDIHRSSAYRKPSGVNDADVDLMRCI